jgi:hypothetical protein
LLDLVKKISFEDHLITLIEFIENGTFEWRNN